MRKLLVFNQVSLDGYFADIKGEMSWAHQHDPEWLAFTEENARGGGELIFGRITYELMASYWPTPLALKSNPAVADRMNSLSKVVFSRTMEKPSWSNTRLIKDDLPAEIRRMKQDAGPDMVIFGSGTIISQLTDEGLIDEYQIVVVPTILGQGKTMFEGVKKRLALKRTSARTFGNGNVFLCYGPAT